MEFREIINKKLNQFFFKKGLALVENSENIIKYKSEELIITLVHDKRENSNSLWIKSNVENEIEIDNNVINEFFGSDLKFDNLSKNEFADIVVQFFNAEGKKLFSGNINLLNRLIKFNADRSVKYTSDLKDAYYLDLAIKAWKAKNYLEFVKNLDEINHNNLSLSIRKKYDIAKKRIKNG